LKLYTEVVGTLYIKTYEAKIKVLQFDIVNIQYGRDMMIEFNVNGTECSVYRDIVPVIQFISSRGSIGKSGGVFRVASGQKKNFIIAVASMIYMAQVSLPKKEEFFRFYDTNQNPASHKNTVVPYPNRTSTPANPSPSDTIPISFTPTNSNSNSSFDRRVPRSLSHPVKPSLDSPRKKRTEELISLRLRKGTVFEREKIRKALQQRNSVKRSITEKPERREHVISAPLTERIPQRPEVPLASGDLFNCWNRLEALASVYETENDS